MTTDTMRAAVGAMEQIARLGYGLEFSDGDEARAAYWFKEAERCKSIARSTLPLLRAALEEGGEPPQDLMALVSEFGQCRWSEGAAGATYLDRAGERRSREEAAELFKQIEECATKLASPTAAPKEEGEPRELPDAIRVPLDELEADAAYILGRVAVDGSCSGIMLEAIRRRTRAIRDALYTRPIAADTQGDAKDAGVIKVTEWPKERSVGRCEDMSPTGKLNVMLDGDSDVIVHVCKGDTAETWESASVEFCTMGQGGGGSPHTRAALIALMVAIEADNAEGPRKAWPPIEGRKAATLSPSLNERKAKEDQRG